MLYEVITIAPLKGPRPKGKRRLLLIIVPLIAILAVTTVYMLSGRYVETDNAYVKADMVPISADVSGSVQAVLVHENQSVVAGQPLFRLDPDSFRIAVSKANADLEQVRSDLQALKASYREKEAEIALQQTRHAFALKDLQRQTNLVARNVISTSSFDAAQQNADLAAQQIAALKLDLHRIAEALGGSVGMPIEQHPSYRSALAELDQARLDLARVEVRAPLARITSYNVCYTKLLRWCRGRSRGS